MKKLNKKATAVAVAVSMVTSMCPINVSFAETVSSAAYESTVSTQRQWMFYNDGVNNYFNDTLQASSTATKDFDGLYIDASSEGAKVGYRETALDTQVNAGSMITIPVNGACTIVVNAHNSSQMSINGESLTASGSGYTDYTYTYTGSESSVVLKFDSNQSYIKSISVYYGNVTEDPTEEETTEEESTETESEFNANDVSAIDSEAKSWNFANASLSYQGNAGYYNEEKGIYIDATNGKCVSRDSDTQVNAGTILYIPVAADGTVTVNANTNGLTYVLDGTELQFTDKVAVYKNTGSKAYLRLEVTGSGSSYLNSISVSYGEEETTEESTETTGSFDPSQTPSVSVKNSTYNFAADFNGNYQGSEGFYNDLFINALNGKCVQRNSDTQVGAGTVMYVPVAESATISVMAYAGASIYINGEKVEAEGSGYINYSYDYSGTASYVKIVFDAQTYITELSVTYPSVKREVITVGEGKQYQSVQDAVDSISGTPSAEDPQIIAIDPGTYEELVTVTKPYVTFVNADETGEEKVTITYDRAVGHADPTKNYGTQYTATVTIAASAKGFTASNITFQNSYNLGSGSSLKQVQAVALTSLADKVVFEDCNFIARQDTLYLKGSSKGDGSSANEARVYLKDCYIEGTIDFVFGDATAYFDNCELFMAYYYNGGHYTAPNTTLSNIGFVFNECKFTVDDSYTTEKVDLGRPWQGDNTYPNYGSQSVFINCAMDDYIIADGYSVWQNSSPLVYTQTNKVRFMEYGTTSLDGSTFDLSQRVAWARILTETQADAYTVWNVLSGSDSWNPASVAETDTISAQDITLNTYEQTVNAGNVYTFTAKVLPATASNKGVVWSVSDETVATIDQNGNLTALEAGTVTVTATSVDGGFSVSSEVTVLNPTAVPVAENVRINSESSLLLVDDVLTASYTFASLEDMANDCSVITWYRVDASGNTEVIQSGTSREYTVSRKDIGCKIFFEVVPETETTYGETGIPVASETTNTVFSLNETSTITMSASDIMNSFLNGTTIDSLSSAKWVGYHYKTNVLLSDEVSLAGKFETAIPSLTALQLLANGYSVSGSASYATDANGGVSSTLKGSKESSVLLYNEDFGDADMTFTATMNLGLSGGLSTTSYIDLYAGYDVESNSGYMFRISRGKNTRSAVISLYRIDNGVETLLATDSTSLNNLFPQKIDEANGITEVPTFTVEMSLTEGHVSAVLSVEANNGKEATSVTIESDDTNNYRGTVAIESFGKTSAPSISEVSITSYAVDSEDDVVTEEEYETIGSMAVIENKTIKLAKSANGHDIAIRIPENEYGVTYTEDENYYYIDIAQFYLTDSENDNATIMPLSRLFTNATETYISNINYLAGAADDSTEIEQPFDSLQSAIDFINDNNLCPCMNDVIVYVECDGVLVKMTLATIASAAPLAPTEDEPTVDEPTVDEPTVDEPTVDEPTVDEPTVDEPTVDEPTVDEPTVDEPTVDEPTVDEPTVDEPTIEGPTVEDVTTGEVAGTITEVESTETITEETTVESTTVETTTVSQNEKASDAKTGDTTNAFPMAAVAASALAACITAIMGKKKK